MCCRMGPAHAGQKSSEILRSYTDYKAYYHNKWLICFAIYLVIWRLLVNRHKYFVEI